MFELENFDTFEKWIKISNTLINFNMLNFVTLWGPHSLPSYKSACFPLGDWVFPLPHRKNSGEVVANSL